MQIAINDTAVINEPGVPDAPMVWGTISTVAADVAIMIKERCGIELTDEQKRHRRDKKL